LQARAIRKYLNFNSPPFSRYYIYLYQYFGLSYSIRNSPTVKPPCRPIPSQLSPPFLS
jgi:hypothetical protein